MRLFLLTLLSLTTSSYVTADVDVCASAAPYVAVPFTNLGTNPTPDPIQNDGMGIFNVTGGWCNSPDTDICANPNGFKRGSFQPDNNPPFCFTIPNVRNRLVEIMVESLVPGDRICVTDTSANAIETQKAPLVNLCANSQVRACFPASSEKDSLSISISCADAEGCSTSETSFWYRVRISAVDWLSAGAQTGKASDSANQQPDMWCQMVKSSSAIAAFPSSLNPANIQVKSSTTSPPTTPVKRNSASMTQGSIFTGLITAVITFVGMRV